MTKSKIFLILSLSFVGGIFLRSFWNVNLFLIYCAVIIVIILISLFYRNKIFLISGFAILFFVGGIWLTDKKLAEMDDLDLAGKSFSGEAMIIKEPEIKDNYQKIVARVKTPSVQKGHSVSKEIKVLINANKYPEYAYGDEIKINCNLEIPKNFGVGPSASSSASSDSAQDETSSFDYKMYLAKDGIFYICQKTKIELLERGRGSKAYAGILKVKNKFNDNINRLIPFPQAGLLSGLILGGSGGTSEELKNNFSRTGMTHIVAVSGYNVTIVAEYLMLLGIFLGLWRKKSFWFAVFGILIFVLMTGLTASAVRAGVMGTLLLWAMKNGRLANSQNAVVFAGAIMLLFNPLLLRYDIGFQLSFLATIGIIYLYPYFESKLNKNSKLHWIWEIFFLSLSAQIFVLPIIVYNFHSLSLISLLANVLILPIIPLTMLLGFLMAMAGFIFTPLATVLAWLTFLPLKYEVETINLLAGFNFSAVEIKNLPWWGVAVWYAILMCVAVYLNKRKINHKKFNTNPGHLAKPDYDLWSIIMNIGRKN